MRGGLAQQFAASTQALRMPSVYMPYEQLLR
jgi:hypothetical protein